MLVNLMLVALAALALICIVITIKDAVLEFRRRREYRELERAADLESLRRHPPEA